MKMHSRDNQDLCKAFLNTRSTLYSWFLCAFALSSTFLSHTTEAAPKDPKVIFGAIASIAYPPPTFTKCTPNADKKQTAVDVS